LVYADIFLNFNFMFSFRNFDLPLNRELRSSLQAIKGVGLRKSNFIASRLGFGYPFFIGNLNFYNFLLISFLLKYLVLSEVRVRRALNFRIRELVNLQTYRGLRHRDFLPVRGQRTRTNASIRKSLRFSTKIY
jgi:small subunit ribosomal protein S13